MTMSLLACGGSQQGDGPCGPGRTLVDNVCVAERVADFIVCIRSRGEVALKADQSRGLTAEAQIVGQKVSTVMEAKNQLEARYTSQAGAEGEKQVIEQCAAVVKETPAAARALPGGAPARPANALFYEDFSGVPEGGAPQGWLGAEHFAVKGGAFTCFEEGPTRFTIPTGALPADVRIELVVTMSQWGCGGLTVESGGLRFGIDRGSWNEAFINSALKRFEPALPVGTQATLALEKRGDVFRLFVDGRELAMGRYPDAAPADGLILTLMTRCGGIGCNGHSNATIHRVAAYPL